MAQSDTQEAPPALQFDRVDAASGGAPLLVSPAVVCAGCQLAIKTQYYDVNGRSLCGACRAAVMAAAEMPTGIMPLAKAAALGAGAGIVGAGIYYALLSNGIEWGIVAALIGYMVGYSVRKGSEGRGGRRFQVLAAALTYLSVALAYAPLAIHEAASQQSAAQSASVPAASAAGTPADANGAGRPSPVRQSSGRSLLGLTILLGLMVALPVLVAIGSLPSGLISAVIISFGIWQAWKMTAKPIIKVLGPYRVGVRPAAAS